MDKSNTVNNIIAIVLCALILIGYSFIYRKFFAPPVEENIEQTAQTEEPLPNEEGGSEDAAVIVSEQEDEEISEENYVIATDRIRVTFTNRGGDIIGYELLDHLDTKTMRGIEMADNITATNRAFSISFGGAEKGIVNDLFVVKEFPEENGEKKIAFAKKYADFTLVKQYTFKDGDYMFKMNVIVDGEENFRSLDFNSQSGINSAYTLRTSPQMGPPFDPKVDRYENRSFISLKGGRGKSQRLGAGQYAMFTTGGFFKKTKGEFDIAGMGGKYFCELVIPADTSVFHTAYYSTSIEANETSNAQAFLERRAITQRTTNDTYYVYVGPRAEKDLKIYNAAENNKWGLNGFRLTEAMQSSGFLSWLEIVLKWLLELIHKVVPNWGVSIIILTILLRIALFPLSLKSALGTSKLQESQPRLKAIQEKYKDNPQKMQAETAKLYQEIGFNPMSGCLPLVLQMFFLLAMFNLFNNYFEFRGSSFVKGWIDDLSVGDSIHSLKVTLPFLRTNQIRILPVIYLASQLLFGKITQLGGAMQAGQSANQMKLMTYGLPIFFFFIFYNAPSGLILFWTVSNVIQMAQQIIINKTKATASKKSGGKNIVRMNKK